MTLGPSYGVRCIYLTVPGAKVRVLEEQSGLNRRSVWNYDFSGRLEPGPRFAV